MKRIIMAAVSAAMTVWSLGAAAKEPVKTVTNASDPRITFVGRTLVDGGKVSFDWTAVYARIKFEGSYLAMTASDTKRNYYDVWIDRPTHCKPDQIISTHGSDSTIVLCSADLLKAAGLPANGKAQHEVTIRKRTEGEQGRTTVSAFVTEGKLLQAEGLKERMIEYIGDSYTCGYGTESGPKERFKAETENGNRAYGAIVARYFDADYIAVAHSGLGVVRNYDDSPKPDMTTRYTQTFDEDPSVKWNAAESSFKPAVTVVYLGTNDFSCGKQPNLGVWTNRYCTLLREIKANYGEEHPILCVSSTYDRLLVDYVSHVVETCGLKNVHFSALISGIYSYETELGADGHPNYSGQTKKAYQLIPYISTITGWSIEPKPIQ